MTAHEWLAADGTFNDGLKVLKELGGNTQAFAAYCHLPFLPPGVKGRLRDEVTKRLLVSMPQPPKSPEGGLPDDLASPLRGDGRGAEPPEVQNLRKCGKRLLKQQADLHTRLKLAADDTERYTIAEQMIETVQPEVDNVYNTLRAYERDGVLPTTDEEQIRRDTVEQMRRVATLESRISRVNGWLKTGKNTKEKLSDKQRQDYEQEVLEKRAELEELKQVLGIE
jgi:hypothetical protein